MKRIITFAITIFLTFFIFQFAINTFKTAHTIKYNYKVNDTKFLVKEIYNKNTGYYLEIKDKDNTFMFNNQNDYNKQKKIIKDIKFINEDGTYCLLPIYKKDNDNDILCINNKELSTYQTLNNRVVLKFIDELKKDKITLKLNSNETINELGLKIYKENLIKNDYITVWNYKGINIINKNKIEEVNILEYDNYDNTLGTLINNYYIVPNYNDKYEYKSYYSIDILSKARKVIKLDNKIDIDCYNNGIVDNKLYLFDKSNKIQYSFEPINSKFKVVGNININAQYYNGKWSTRNIYDFVNDKVIFEKSISDKLNYSYKSIYESKVAYYFNDVNGNFYKVFKNNLNKRIFLFKNKNATNIKLVEDTIYYLEDDTIYSYMDGYGIRPLITNSEFKFNNKNIYNVYKK